ncbi:MAG: hypothetical protein ACI4WX_10150 [Aristaeellaceae bacterium]
MDRKKQQDMGTATAALPTPTELMELRQMRTRQGGAGVEEGIGQGKPSAGMPLRMGQTGEESFAQAGMGILQQEKRMTRERISEAMHTLDKYRAGKASVESRIIRAQQWWKMRNWEQIEAERGTKGTQKVKSNTAWLWNCIVGKHAEAMDAFPEPLFLARTVDDEAEAKHLSEIVPVVLEQNGFEEVYSQCAWQKETEGTALYGVFWDGRAMNGMGDIKVRKINVLNFFAEPGIQDIQDSRNVFHVRLVHKDTLEQQHPNLQGKLGGNPKKIAEYMHDDNVDNQDKAMVVDWYYKNWQGGKQVLHYCQFVGSEIIYASEDDPACAERGYYEDGLYPFVNDVLFPVADSIYGIGYIDVGKDTQTDIDTMSQAMVTNATITATPRYFRSKSSGVNDEEFLDMSKPLVTCNGNLGSDSVMPIQTQGLPSNALEMYQEKIEELKFITGNTDVQNGTVPSGVTSGIAIQALKEDAGRSSKDASRTSYRAMKRLYTMVIERIRQFYTLQRQFRIVGEDGAMRYMLYSNAGLQMQSGIGIDGQPTYRLPIIDVEVHVQRESAYTRMALNDLATQFYQMGVFNPMMAQQSLMMLSMMEFKGKESVVQKVMQGQQMLALQSAMGQAAMQPQAGQDGQAQTGKAREDPVEAGKSEESQATSPAIERMRTALDESIRPS